MAGQIRCWWVPALSPTADDEPHHRRHNQHSSHSADDDAGYGAADKELLSGTISQFP